MTGPIIVGQDLKRLIGETFLLRNPGSPNASIPFRIINSQPGWPRTGFEAYALLGECEHPTRGTIPSVLKLFKQDIPERQARSLFLVRLGLAKAHDWLLQGVPYGVLNGLEVNGVRLVGHVAHRVEGEDIFRLRENDAWNLSFDERRRIAGHLCCAVAVLEALDIVHGDISARNVIIGTSPDKGPAAILCDFDGFHHPQQSLLPRACRPQGSPGYRHPMLLERLDRKDPNTYVDTDRFALAAMTCEIMTWEPDDAKRYQRAELLEETDLRDMNRLPMDVIQRWKSGAALLQNALQARTGEEMPSPADWMRALGVNIIPPLGKPRPFAGSPRLEIVRQRGTFLQPVGIVHLKNPSGNFKPIHSELAQVEFKITNNFLTLEFGWPWPVFLIRGEFQYELGDGPKQIAVQPGDLVVSNQWRFTMEASS